MVLHQKQVDIQKTFSFKKNNKRFLKSHFWEKKMKRPFLLCTHDIILIYFLALQFWNDSILRELDKIKICLYWKTSDRRHLNTLRFNVNVIVEMQKFVLLTEKRDYKRGPTFIFTKNLLFALASICEYFHAFKI